MSEPGKYFRSPKKLREQEKKLGGGGGAQTFLRILLKMSHSLYKCRTPKPNGSERANFYFRIIFPKESISFPPVSITIGQKSTARAHRRTEYLECCCRSPRKYLTESTKSSGLPFWPIALQLSLAFFHRVSPEFTPSPRTTLADPVGPRRGV
jgi:hypothetical protein